MPATVRSLLLVAFVLIASTAGAQPAFTRPAPPPPPPQGPQAGWRVLGNTDVSSGRRDRRVIDVRFNMSMSVVRLCVDNGTIQLHGARARFSNNSLQALAVPGRLESGRCSMPMPLTSPRMNLLAVEITATSLGPGRARVRLEGR